MEAPKCPRCGDEMPQSRPTGRPATWCSPRCKRAAYEERRAAANGAIAVKVVERVKVEEHPLSECSRRVAQSPAGCRTFLKHLAQLARQGDLENAKWSSTLRAFDDLQLLLRRR